MTKITCPHCNQQIDIDEAVTHQAEAKITAQFQKDREAAEKKQLELLQLLEEQKKLQESTLKAALIEQEARDKKVYWEIAQVEAEKKIREKTDQKQKDLEAQLAEQEKRTKLAEAEQLEMLKKQRELIQEKQQSELTLQKKLTEQLKEETEKIQKVASEKSADEKQQMQKQIDDMKKALEEAQRKGTTVSQQLQGEVMELQIEDLLREAFPSDLIGEVKKGVNGADILQTVKNSYGKSVGIIVWESKQTLIFQDKWLGKLREDARAAGGSIAVLVTRKLPEGISTCAERERVWITGLDFVLPLAQLLRQQLLKVDQEKISQNGKDVKAEMLYQYINSQEFIGNVEGVVESFKELKDDLDRERTAMQKLWKKREMQILRLATHAAHMYGGVQGIVGNSLPSINGLDLESGEEPELQIESESKTKEQNELF